MAMRDLTILAIDDNRDNLTTLKAVVSDRLPGTRILTAQDGRQGIELALAEDPDVILLDIVMPGMDGYAVCGKIKGNSLLETIPVIFLTAIRTDQESRFKALEMGAEGFLAKPFDEVELIAQITVMAKIRKANRREQQEKVQLAALVAERTQELEKELAERRRAEEAFVESNERFLSLADNIPGYVAYVNANTLRYEFVNVAYEKSFGIPREKIIGSHVKEILGETKYQFALEFINAARQGRAIFYENTFDLVSGQSWLQVAFSPVFDTNGDVVSLVVLSFDITDRKRAEQALSESESRYRRITEGLADYQYTVRVENGRALETKHSPACLMVTGYSAEEFAADPYLWFNMVTPDDRLVLIDRVQQVLAGQNIPPLEHKIIRKDGELRWVSDSIICYRNTSGVLLSYDGVVKDITERKRSEEEKKHLQAQLQQAQKMEAIGTLAGGIAHDFNNILGAILGYAEMAREDSAAGSVTAGDLDQVIKAGNRAKELVKQILAFSRQTKAQQIPLQPAAIVKESIKLLRSSLPTTIVIQQDIDPDLNMVVADPTQIHQILMNLCTNAYHAMEETGGILSISLKNEVLSQVALDGHPDIQPGNFIHLSIGDSGPGIAPEIQERIFDPYFTTKEVGKGTGMGLAIVHGIVKSYGGFIVCRSVIGEGTVFDIKLPAMTEPSVPEAKPVTINPVGNERILFIDDEKILTEMAQSMLQRLGYTVTICTSSLEALAIFQSQPDAFDLVITDQTMPGMTGLDLSRRMLQIRPDLPIILCTGYSSQVSEEKARSAGIRGFALKPLAKKDIAALIREVLDRGKSIL